LQSAIAPEFPTKNSDDARTLKALLAATGGEKNRLTMGAVSLAFEMMWCERGDNQGWGKKGKKETVFVLKLNLSKGTP
jgi:hypothetical protein